MAFYSDYLKNSLGKPVPAVQACLYDLDGNRIDVDVTDRKGYYEFFGVPAGNYMIKFYGMGMRGDIPKYVAIAGNEPEIKFKELPILTLEEGPRSTYGTTCIYLLSGLLTDSGDIGNISFEYTTSGISGLTDWIPAANLNIDAGLSGITSNDLGIIMLSGVLSLESISVPALYDFRVRFFNPDGKVAKDPNDLENKKALEVLAFDIPFLGVSGNWDPAAIRFDNDPSLYVEEGEGIVGKTGLKARALYTLTDLTTSAGSFSKAVLYYSISGITEDWVHWMDVYPPTISGTRKAANINTISGTAFLDLYDIPTVYNFKARFLNPYGVPAEKYEKPYEAFELNQEFNGLADLGEYVGVKGVKVDNWKLISGSDPSQLITLPSNEVTLSWPSGTEMVAGDFINAVGIKVPISKEQLKAIEEYVVYMFISNSGAYPANGTVGWYSPGTTPIPDSNGKWYHMGITKTNNVKLRLPKKKKVLLWVGFKYGEIKTSLTQEVPKY